MRIAGVDSGDSPETPFWNQRLGGDVYNSVGMTGVQRSAIDDLVALTIGTAMMKRAGGAGKEERPGTAALPEEPEPPIKLARMARELYTNGSLVIQDLALPESEGVAPSLMPDVFVESGRLIKQYNRASSGLLRLNLVGDDVERVFTDPQRELRLGKDGAWTSWKIEGLNRGDGSAPSETQQKDEQTGALISIPASQLHAHEGGRGILYYAQHSCNCYEENARVQRRVMRGTNLIPWLLNSTVTQDQMDAAFGGNPKHVIAIPGNGNKIDIVSEAVLNMLLHEAGARKAELMDALNVVEKDQPDRPVARDRELRMRVMLQFVKATQRDLKALYRVLGYELSFSEIVITGAAERLQEADLLDRAYTVAGMTPEEYAARYKALVG